MTQRDDQPPAADSDDLARQVNEFLARPNDAIAFAMVRDALRAAGRATMLADACATFAVVATDPIVQADAWSEAGEVRWISGDRVRGKEELQRALAIDPTNQRALELLIYDAIEHQRAAAAATWVEREIAELDRRAAAMPMRPGYSEPLSIERARAHQRAANIWQVHLGRLDRALSHLEQAWLLEPENGEALDIARAIYRSLGDFGMVASLYQAELEGLGDEGPAPQRAHILLELGRLAAKRGDLANAVANLERGLALHRESTAIMEALAEIYALPEAVAVGGGARASELFIELARRIVDDTAGRAARSSAENNAANDAELGFLRRSLGADPQSERAFEVLAEALARHQRFADLDSLLRQRTAIVAGTNSGVPNVGVDVDAVVRLLQRRLELYDGSLPDSASRIAVLIELMSLEPPHGPASQRLRATYAAESRWTDLVALIEAELPNLNDDPHAQIRELLALATIVREQLAQHERAAELLHRALTIDPRNEEAMARYADHFRERRDWRGLADLFEFSLDSAIAAGADVAEQVKRLDEIAQLAEQRLGEMSRAVETWQRVLHIDQHNKKAIDALRRLETRMRMWAPVLRNLEDDIATARTTQLRVQAMHRMAQTFRERQLEPRRAMALYEQILSESPDDTDALKALIENYERDGEDVGLASALRRHIVLDALVDEATDSLPASATPLRDRSQTRRAERVSRLRKLLVHYENALLDPDGVVFAGGAILELIPGDHDALDRMERILERTGDARLVPTLEYHAAAASNAAERAKVLRKLARVAAEAGDQAGAMARWEQALSTLPSDQESLRALADLYERIGHWQDLASALERLDLLGDQPIPGTPAGTQRIASLERFARVVDERLDDPFRAIEIWLRVLDIAPRHRTAMDSIARLTQKTESWRQLVEIQTRQIELHRERDQELAAAIAFERATLLEEQLGVPDEAVLQLEALIDSIGPTHEAGHAMLRRLYEARGDYAAAVRIAERQLYFTRDVDDQIARGKEIGIISRDRLGDPLLALQAFERVLQWTPTDDIMLTTVASLQAELGMFTEQVQTIEQRIPLAATISDRRALITEIAGIVAGPLANPAGAFRWLRRAHDEDPSSASLNELRCVATAFALWRELAEVLDQERRRVMQRRAPNTAPPPEAFVSFVGLSRQLAQLHEHELGDPSRAITVLFDALALTPRDRTLLDDAERIATSVDQRAAWTLIRDGYEIVIAKATPVERVELYEHRATLLEERLGDQRAAAADLLSAFSWNPDRVQTRVALQQLAERGRGWNDMIAVETALAERAFDPGERMQALRRKADIIEAQLLDPPRAFRTHLVAFMLAPDDAETTAHLWRLGRIIGRRYRDADRQSKPGDLPASIASERTVAETLANATSREPTTMRAPIRGARLATEELGEGEIVSRPAIEIPGPIESGQRDPRDNTQPIELAELESAIESEIATSTPRRARNDATVEISADDFAEESSQPAIARPALPPPSPRRTPPPPPQSQQVRAAAAPAAPPRAATAPVRRNAIPSLPIRDYESPWAEWAAIYEALPLADADERLQAMFRAADVWESGANDVARAFEVLTRAFANARTTPDGDVAVRQRLHKLAADHNEWDRLAEFYATMVERAYSGASAADLLIEIAEIRITQARPEDAEEQYRRVLGIRPDDERARGQLEAMYRAANRWSDLAASLEERTHPRLSAAVPENERPPLLRELSAIYLEQLQRPYDAIDALERLRALEPHAIAIANQLATLYSTVSRLSKAVEMFTVVREIAGDRSDDGITALRRIGETYETGMELPDRAIEAYVSLLHVAPTDRDAMLALDRLYQSHGRWAQLSDELLRRAAMTTEDEEHARLLSRRAQLLVEHLGDADQAAELLQRARAIATRIGNASFAGEIDDQLVTALNAAHRAPEAAAVVEARIAQRAQAAPDELASLYVRLAHLRVASLNVAGANEALTRALDLVADYPAALALIDKLTSAEENPTGFVAARLAEADRTSDDGVRIAAWIAAAHTLQDRLQDSARARELYNRVLRIQPDHAEATWALAELMEHEGDIVGATEILERRLANAAPDNQERARISTQLAALAQLIGLPWEAEHRLREALAASPIHIPAIVALSALYRDIGRDEDLVAFLRDALADGAIAGAPSAMATALYRRFAAALERVEKHDEAYAALIDADRKYRGDLLIKLALGKNRFAAEHWHESAQQLAPLGQHADAAQYAVPVAEGLCLAAVAEIRGLRPDRAPALYERALQLDPSNTTALAAAAAAALAQGHVPNAADLLSRQANATIDGDEQLRLYEALGDLCLMKLHDEARARRCYESAVACADPIAAKHVPLLAKLLELCDTANDHLGAARAAEQMAAFGTSPADRTARYVHAARDYLLGEQRDRARAAAEKALANDPHELRAADIVSQIAADAGEVEFVIELLETCLAGSDDRDAVQQAMLWARLAQARATRGEHEQALHACERAIELAPGSPGAVIAHRQLVALIDEMPAPVKEAPLKAGGKKDHKKKKFAQSKSDAAKRPSKLPHLRAIAAATAEVADIVAWGDELRRATSATAATIDAARVAFEVARALGHSLDEQQRAFVAAHPSTPPKPDENYRGTLDEKDRTRWILDERVEYLAPLMTDLAEAAALLWPDAGEALTRAGFRGAQRVDASVRASSIAMYPCIASAAGTGAAMMYGSIDTSRPIGDSASRPSTDVAVVCAGAPLLVLSSRFLRGPFPSDAEIRFQLGRTAELARPECLLVAGLPRAHATRLLAAAVRLYGPASHRAAIAHLIDEAEVQRAYDDVLRQTVPQQLRERMEQQLAALSQPISAADFDRYAAACNHAADRVGMLFAGDVAVAIAATRAVTGETPRHLVVAATNEAWLAARMRLGVASR